MAEPTQVHDVVVIGAGPGGYVAALRAAGHGLSVAVVERDRLGGVCANEGCIPTKTLLRSAEVYDLARRAASFGISIDGLRFDIRAIVERARQTAARMEKNVGALLRAAGVPVVRGTARLAGKGRVLVSGDGKETLLEARHIVLATGTSPSVPPGFESDGNRVWTYRDALVPAAMPGSIIVLGGGAIGVELASFYRALGTEVTIVETLARILPDEDADIGEAMRRALQKRGIRILTEAVASDLATSEVDVTVTVETNGKKNEIRAERVLVATGVQANLDGLGIEQTRVEVTGGHVVVDEWLRTGEEGVYAIGDLAGPPWLAHKASREAEVCIDHIAGVSGVRALAAGASPSCIYSMPQVASVGLSEEAARNAGRAVRCGRSSFAGNGKARASGDTEGFVKTVFDAGTGELLGAHMIGPDVTELVATFALARTLEATEEEILATVFPHPTLSESLGESVRNAFAAGTAAKPKLHSRRA